MFSKQIIHKYDNQIKNELSQVWKELISKIESFERQYYIKDELQSNLKRINDIKTNLEIIENLIREETFSKKYFEITIIFEKLSERETEKRFLIINDEYVNWIPIDKR